MFLLTTTKLVFNTATPPAVDAGNFTFDHDDSLLPGELAGSTADGTATADNGIADAAKNGTTDAYPSDIEDPASPSTTSLLKLTPWLKTDG